MNWGQFKTLVADQLKIDGEANVDYTVTTIGGSFDLRCVIEFQALFELTFARWVDRAVLTLATNDREVNLLDSLKCASPIFLPMGVWVSNAPLERVSVSQQSGVAWVGALQTGTPYLWSPTGHGKILFNCPCSGAFSSNYASGYALHADLSADNITVDLPNNLLLPAAMWVATGMKGAASGSEPGLNRLQRYDQQAYIALRRFAGANKQRIA